MDFEADLLHSVAVGAREVEPCRHVRAGGGADRHDTLVDPVRDDPRFIELMEKTGFAAF